MNNITFFIPAYNCAGTIEESVDSIMQTNFYDGDELIITNDCSTDNTHEVLNRIKSKYPGVHIINHSHNKGGAATRNTCIENSKNELLFCLDSDNVLAENSISTLKGELIKQAADIASFQEMRYFNTQQPNETSYIWRFLPNTSLSDFMADNKNPGSSGNYLFTKKSWLLAKGYPEFSGALDTWGFCFRQLVNGSKLITLPGSYYFHRYGSDSYYVRDMNSRNMSIAALQIIIPYYNRIDPEDLEYIMSKEHRLTWFDNLHIRPIRIADEPAGVRAASIYIEQKNKNNMLKKIVNVIRNL